MIRLFLLFLFLSIEMVTEAQTDSALLIKDRPGQIKKTPAVKLTIAEKNWLNKNYKLIAGLKKDSALSMVKKNFISINEASLEYLIGLATKMQKEDNSQRLAMLQQQLTTLQQQKQILLTKIQQKMDSLAATTNTAKKQSIEVEIMRLKNDLSRIELQIQLTKNEISRLENGS